MAETKIEWCDYLAWDAQAKAAGVRMRVFCLSLGDVFEDRPELEGERDRLAATIQNTPHLDWLLELLTKDQLADLATEWSVELQGSKKSEHVDQLCIDGHGKPTPKLLRKKPTTRNL